MLDNKLGNRLRVDFSNISKQIEIPNLLQLQKKSFDYFLNLDNGESGIEKFLNQFFLFMIRKID